MKKARESGPVELKQSVCLQAYVGNMVAQKLAQGLTQVAAFR